jgi:hypothetical protein
MCGDQVVHASAVRRDGGGDGKRRERVVARLCRDDLAKPEADSPHVVPQRVALANQSGSRSSIAEQRLPRLERLRWQRHLAEGEGSVQDTCAGAEKAHQPRAAPVQFQQRCELVDVAAASGAREKVHLFALQPQIEALQTRLRFDPAATRPCSCRRTCSWISDALHAQRLLFQQQSAQPLVDLSVEMIRRRCSCSACSCGSSSGGSDCDKAIQRRQRVLDRDRASWLRISEQALAPSFRGTTRTAAAAAAAPTAAAAI